MAMARERSSNATDCVMIVAHVQSFSEMNGLQSALRGILGVVNVQLMSLKAGTAHIEVMYKNVVPLEHQLQELYAARWRILATQDGIKIWL